MTAQEENAKRTATSPRAIGIPVSQIDEVLRLCARNIRRFINDMGILLKDSSDWHAIALAIFAFEELAKYSELRKSKESAAQDIVMVDERLFGKGKDPHGYKQNIARNLIQQDAMILIFPYFDSTYFDARHFHAEPDEMSHALRLDCVYVNWKDGKWIHGTPVVPDRIMMFTEAILDRLNRLESGSP